MNKKPVARTLYLTTAQYNFRDFLSKTVMLQKPRFCFWFWFILLIQVYVAWCLIYSTQIHNGVWSLFCLWTLSINVGSTLHVRESEENGLSGHHIDLSCIADTGSETAFNKSTPCLIPSFSPDFSCLQMLRFEILFFSGGDPSLFIASVLGCTLEISQAKVTVCYEHLPRNP